MSPPLSKRERSRLSMATCVLSCVDQRRNSVHIVRIGGSYPCFNPYRCLVSRSDFIHRCSIVVLAVAGLSTSRPRGTENIDDCDGELIVISERERNKLNLIALTQSLLLADLHTTLTIRQILGLGIILSIGHSPEPTIRLDPDTKTGMETILRPPHTGSRKGGVNALHPHPESVNRTVRSPCFDTTGKVAKNQGEQRGLWTEALRHIQFHSER
jgi:hypothetical protein